MSEFDRFCEDCLKAVNDSIDYDPDELAKGIKVEMEHTTNKEAAETIAKQHLAEVSDYYTRLEKIDPHN